MRATAVITFLILAIQRLRDGGAPTLVTSFNDVVSSGWYQLFLVVFVLIIVRRILFRLGDKEV